MKGLRRARPLLGTLVEIGNPEGSREGVEAAFAAVAQVERLMSRFLPGSDIDRFNAASAGAVVELHPWTREVLELAKDLEGASGGRFDVALGSGRWELSGDALLKVDGGTRLDLGGIAKGEAVDRALDALLARGGGMGWVNAGGDIRVAGMELPIGLRDEVSRQVRVWLKLRDASVATSCFPREDPGRLWGRPGSRHVSVCAPSCRVADALTKVAALGAPSGEALLERFGARVWIHP